MLLAVSGSTKAETPKVPERIALTMLDIVQNDQQWQLQQQQLEQQQLLLAQQQLVLQQMAQQPTPQQPEQQHYLLAQQPMFPPQPQVPPPMIQPQQDPQMQLQQQLDQQQLLLAQQQMLLQQMAQQHQTQQAVQQQVWTPQQQVLTPPPMALPTEKPSVACTQSTTKSPLGIPVNPYWETLPANRRENTAHAPRGTGTSPGFYIGGFGGAALLPTDLWSDKDSDEWTGYYSSYGYYNEGWAWEESLRPKVGYNIGLALGYDFSEHWGIESRLHIMKMKLDYKESLTKWDDLFYYEEYHASETTSDYAERTLTIFDVSSHYYPWGNVKCSPYFKAGLGYANQKISYEKIRKSTESSDTLTMPLGIGLRYQWSPQISFRAELTDNILFKSKVGNLDIKTNHNLALTAGITYSFGSGRVQPVRRY